MVDASHHVHSKLILIYFNFNAFIFQRIIITDYMLINENKHPEVKVEIILITKFLYKIIII